MLGLLSIQEELTTTVNNRIFSHISIWNYWIKVKQSWKQRPVLTWDRQIFDMKGKKKILNDIGENSFNVFI